MAKKALGKGLGAIFGEDFSESLKEREKEAGERRKTAPAHREKEEVAISLGEGYSYGSGRKESSDPRAVSTVKTSLVEPNRNQPRKRFEEESLRELSDSMKKFGVLQPLLVKKNGDMYEIIAGERRWRAAKLAGLKEIPVIVKELQEKEAAEIALIENIQREDLNPVEEAEAYRRLIDEFGLTQEELAQRLSKNRSTITNSLRLLSLDERVRELLSEGKLSGGHARTLVTVEDKDRQYELSMEIIEKGMSVREAEALLKREKSPSPKKPAKNKNDEIALYLENLAEKLTESLGTKVSIAQGPRNRGKISIEYYSSEDLERITEILRRK